MGSGTVTSAENRAVIDLSTGVIERTNAAPSRAADWGTMASPMGPIVVDSGTPPSLGGVSAASPICSDFQTFCPDWLHFGHFLCFGGIAASQLSHRIFPIYF